MRGVAGVLAIAALVAQCPAAEWQWSVPDGKTRAYLWIAPQCEYVRAIVLANHNMIEQGILEHPIMRKTLAQLGIAEVWAVPTLDVPFDFHNGAGEHFQRVMDALAAESGYEELRWAPVVPLGHSACATFPWNFAAWNAERTLAVLSVHGDAPQTGLTGYGRANVDWGERSIDGVPGLMVMAEQEWNEARLEPALAFAAKHPSAPLALLADAGHGHFDFSDELVSFLAMFIRKAAEMRLPSRTDSRQPPRLKPVDPAAGWRIDRWRRDEQPAAPAAPFHKYKGPTGDAFWCFDREMAQATESICAAARGKKPQLIGFAQGSALLAGDPVRLDFEPDADAITFHVAARFLDQVPGADSHLALWSGLAAGSALGHATHHGPIRTSKVVGPARVAADGTCVVELDRSVYTPDRRNNDVWVLAHHPGDETYKSAVQQALVRIAGCNEGSPQTITFDAVEEQATTTRSIKLHARSDAELPVRFYVREGPAEVQGDRLMFTAIPKRTEFPLKVTVVAWQLGRCAAPKVKAADPVEMTVSIVERP